MKAFGITVASIIGILGLTWILQGSDFFLTKFFAPRYEQVRRETFEQSKAYRQGTVQELEAQYLQYAGTKDEGTRDAIASIALHQVADFPINDLPAHLQTFVLELRSRRTGTELK